MRCRGKVHSFFLYLRLFRKQFPIFGILGKFSFTKIDFCLFRGTFRAVIFVYFYDSLRAFSEFERKFLGSVFNSALNSTCPENNSCVLNIYDSFAVDATKINKSSERKEVTNGKSDLPSVIYVQVEYRNLLARDQLFLLEDDRSFAVRSIPSSPSLHGKEVADLIGAKFT